MATAQISDALTELVVPIADLRPHPENPRKGDVAAIRESLREFGQVRPIVVLPDGTIVAGHHVFYAAQEEGWDQIAVVKPDLTPEQARRYLLADNRLAELGGYDQEALGTLLNDIMDAGQLAGTGWQPDAIDDLLAEMGQTDVTAKEEFQGDYIESPEETAARWQGDGDGTPAQPMREVVLMLRADEFEEFGTQLRALKEYYSLDATTATIREAIKREAQRAKNG